jgi:DNA-binding SARP family transcriptional activator/tetratricopeptide (TPR) repeat protein
MVGGVEMRVESDQVNRPAAGHGVQLRMLGPLRISRDGVAVPLPASRKVRALVAYLTLTPHSVRRSHLCELLWDVPNDPRGELRWSLSKVRGILDQPGRQRIKTSDDTVTLDLGDCFVDVLAVARAMRDGVEKLTAEQLRGLSALFAGDFLEGLQIDRSPHFDGWLLAQRRRFRSAHVAVLEHLVSRLPRESDEVFGPLERWLRLAPFDRRAHEVLLDALARHGRISDGDEHLAATARTFDAEGLSWAPLRDAWRGARRQASVVVTLADPSESAERSSIGDVQVAATTARRASIAVMPFLDRTDGSGARGGPADGLAHDIITRLAKLRSLFVIAQGTVFALDERSVGPEMAGRTLNVDYVASGSLRRQGNRLIVAIELTETRTDRVIWAETFDEKADSAFYVLDQIGDRIVASIASEIETTERNRAILKPPSSLDAWEAHHRGLWHMYRFNRPDNERAQHYFEMAVRLDPTFARAHAGLSFTHFQNAFQGWGERDNAVDLAFQSAGQSLMVDDRDPTAHWAMGRALWLRGQQDQSVVELETAVELSPNFALGHYTLAFVRSQSGDPRAAIEASDHSRQLSPFDPLLFAMLATRAIALVRLGRFDEAADWAVKAMSRPNAHAHILAIAACCLALAGRNEEAHTAAASIRRTRPDYRIGDFLSAFRFAPEAVAIFRQGAERIGFK